MHFGKSGENLRHQRTNCLDRIGESCQHHNSDSATFQVLLVQQILIRGDEALEASGFCARKKFAVLKGGPSLILHRSYFVTSEVVPESLREGLVKKQQQD